MSEVRADVLEAKQLEDYAEEIILAEGSMLEAEDAAVRLDNFLQSLQLIVGSFTENDFENEEYVDLQRELTRVARVLGRTRDRLRAMVDATSSQYKAPAIRDGSMGRPRLHIMEEQLRMFQQLGFSWTDMARMLGKTFNLIRIFAHFICNPYGGKLLHEK